MFKALIILYKGGKLLWPIIKEVVFSKEDKSYVLKNKQQIFLIASIIVLTVMVGLFFEDATRHGLSSKYKDGVITKLNTRIEVLEKANKELLEKECESTIDIATLQNMLLEKKEQLAASEAKAVQ